MNVVGLYSAERRSKSATATPEKIPSPPLGKRFIHSRPRVATTYSCGNTQLSRPRVSARVCYYVIRGPVTSSLTSYFHTTTAFPKSSSSKSSRVNFHRLYRRLVRPAQILPLTESKYNTHVNIRSRFPVDGRRD